MRLTLGMTGMDSATEAALKAAVEQANADLVRPWQVLSEAEASHVVVDMDSMYGPMSWLRLHAAGKQVIGLSSAARTQTDFHLARPFDATSVGAMLARAADAKSPEAASASASPAESTDIAAETSEVQMQAPTGPQLAPEPADEIPAEAELPDEQPTADPTVEAAPALPAGRRLADWIAPGMLSGRVRYQPAGKTALLIDADKRQYHGPATLKPLAGHFKDVLDADDFSHPDDAAWDTEAGALGVAQPLARLQWYGGLLAGTGALLPGFDPASRYRLGKWPQTEREFPKHFRLATTMMKGPDTVDGIAAGSGVARAEVIDFINANLVSGFAEFVPEPPPEPTEPPKPTGLFGRLRGK